MRGTPLHTAEGQLQPGLLNCCRRRCFPHAPQQAVALTALEVAQGLEHLHHPDRRLVHRDLSAANVLLTTSTSDARGFRALLSDFGAWLRGGCRQDLGSQRGGRHKRWQKGGRPGLTDPNLSPNNAAQA